MKGLAAAVASFILLAGCAAESESAALPSGSSEPQSPSAFEVSSTHGAIEGLVVDSSITPIEGANVSLLLAGNDVPMSLTTSAVDGRFGFGLLQPGTYSVYAERAGYGNATTIALVEAERTTPVRVVVDEVAGNDPYIALAIENGIISCGVAIVVVSAVCLPAQTQPVFGPFKVAIFYNVPVGHQALVAETDWANRPQVMRQWFMHDETRDNNFEGDWLGDAIGPAVLRKSFVPGQRNGFVPATVTAHPFPPSDQNFTLMTATYFDGNYQREINGTASPACRANPILGYCSGVGVALQLRFTQYVSIFVHEAPGNLATYSAIPDQ